MRRLLARLLLALALAWAGPAAYAHALTHLGAPPASHHHATDGDEQDGGNACELCAAFAGASALGTAPVVTTLVREPALVATPHSPDRLIPCEALARFATHAPPVSR